MSGLGLAKQLLMKRNGVVLFILAHDDPERTGRKWQRLAGLYAFIVKRCCSYARSVERKRGCKRVVHTY
jgi:hypothetical protein